jgi:hypothetical protein
MAAGAVIHTTKHGDCTLKGDWIGSPELDVLTKHLDEDAIFAAAKLGRGEIEDIRRLAA